MGPRDYTACPTTSSEDAFGDALSTTLSETELKKGWRSMGRSTHIIIAGFLFSLVVLNGLSLYFWFGLSGKDVTMKEHKILDYFRKLLQHHSRACLQTHYGLRTDTSMKLRPKITGVCPV